MNFENRMAIITGGSSGIGLATARLLVEQGAHVWLLARREELLKKALAEVESARRSTAQFCGMITADVSDIDQIYEAVAKVTDRSGIPDLVINSAGVVEPGYVQELDLEVFRWMMEVNYFGTVYITKAVLPGMLARGSGHIVNVSSIAGLVGVFGYTAYGASKYAIRGFSDVLRAEVKPLGVNVSIVFPPDTDTPQLEYDNRHKPPEGKILSSLNSVVPPEVVAKSILRGIARNRYIILPNLESKLTYWLISLAGTVQYPVMDWLVAWARRKTQNKKGYPSFQRRS